LTQQLVVQCQDTYYLIVDLETALGGAGMLDQPVSSNLRLEDEQVHSRRAEGSAAECPALAKQKTAGPS